MTTTTTPTTTPPEAPCPHCGQMNPLGAAFCESCGKALPTPASSGPRVVSADAMPQSALGQRLVSDELVKQTKKAATALLVVGIIQLTCGAVLLTVLKQAAARTPGMPQPEPFMFVALFGLGAIFIGLYFWARTSPLPASIVGLCLYVTLVAVNVVTSISALAEDPDAPRTGFGGIGIGWLDIVIIVVLVQAISAGVKHKKLLEQMGQPA